MATVHLILLTATHIAQNYRGESTVAFLWQHFYISLLFAAKKSKQNASNDSALKTGQIRKGHMLLYTYIVSLASEQL